MSLQTFTVINVVMEDREDGGLRVYSDDLPGLILSGDDRKKVCDSIKPAIKALFEYRGVGAVTVHESKSLHELLNHDSPRNVDMQVQHEQFVVEVAAAA